jgi:hypothetical protein
MPDSLGGSAFATPIKQTRPVSKPVLTIFFIFTPLFSGFHGFWREGAHMGCDGRFAGYHFFVRNVEPTESRPQRFRR